MELKTCYLISEDLKKKKRTQRLETREIYIRYKYTYRYIDTDTLQGVSTPGVGNKGKKLE